MRPRLPAALRRGSRARRSGSSGPVPLDDLPAPGSGDYEAFLRTMLPRQASGVASYRFGDERVWLKRSGPRHGPWRYRALALLAGALRLDVLAPVPNPGGHAAIEIEARRLRALGDAGLRVPRVLAVQADGLLISDLGESGSNAIVFQERLDQSVPLGPGVFLSVWSDGLAALARVHAAGQYLSQAFDRNLVCCPDGEIGFVDFEDDPGESLSLAECQARDWLSFLHSTAMLVDAASPHGAGERWHAALQAAQPPVRERLALAARRMRWLRRLPRSRRFGRDTQRARALAWLLGSWYGPGN